MGVAEEQHRFGLDYLAAVTALLQRNRAAHPTAGMFEAADLQWWWRTPRPTDTVPQLFWFDADGRPDAAVIATDWGDRVALDALVLPDASPERRAHVTERGLAHAEACGFGTLGFEIDADDTPWRDLLARHGFAVTGDGVTEAWLATDARPPVSPLRPGYRLAARADTAERPHPLVSRCGPDVAARLRQASLYRADLDLVVLDEADRDAAYGLFWFDPVTATGLVEPMRTEDAHQRRGLARHVLTAGLDRLARAGATRVKICFEPDNAAAAGLYLDVGFVPHRRTVTVERRAAGATS